MSFRNLQRWTLSFKRLSMLSRLLNFAAQSAVMLRQTPLLASDATTTRLAALFEEAPHHQNHSKVVRMISVLFFDHAFFLKPADLSCFVAMGKTTRRNLAS
jgi:hypothetical protein